MANIGEITLHKVGSHSVRLEHAKEPSAGIVANYSWHVIKEELFPQFLTTWRGVPVLVEMNANRYEHSSGMSEWRIYATAAYKCSAEPNEHGYFTVSPSVTDTARARLGTECQPNVSEWLASVDYALSRERAINHALGRIARDMRGYGDPPSRDLRAATVAMSKAHEITRESSARWEKVANAFDRYQEQLSKAGA